MSSKLRPKKGKVLSRLMVLLSVLESGGPILLSNNQNLPLNSSDLGAVLVTDQQGEKVAEAQQSPSNQDAGTVSPLVTLSLI